MLLRPSVKEPNYWCKLSYRRISKLNSLNNHILPRSTINRLSSSVKLDPFMATLFPMSSHSLNLSGLVSAQIVRLLKSGAFCMTRFIALSPVGSPTSDTMTIMLLVFFSRYSKTKSWGTRFMRRSSLAKWAPGRSTKVRVVNSGPEEEERARSRNYFNTSTVQDKLNFRMNLELL